MKRCRRIISAAALVGIGVIPTTVHAQSPTEPVEANDDAATAQVTPNEQLEVILAFDASESMWPAIKTARAAANEFVASMPADVRIGVETFGDTVEVLTPPTTDRELITSKIASIVPSGQTALYDVVVAASQHFTPGIEHQVIVLVSDGKDDGSKHSLDDAIWASSRVQIEAISLTGTETDIESLMALGAVTPADDADALSAAFSRVSGLIADVIASTTTTTTSTTTTTTTATTTPAPVTTTAAAPPPVVSAPPAPEAVVVPASRSSLPLWLGGVAVFAGLLLLALMLVPTARVSRTRLGVAKPRRVSEFGTRTTSAIDDALVRHGKSADLGATLAVADISMKPAEFIGLVGLVAIVAGLVGLLLVGPLVAVLVTVGVCLAAWFYVSHAKSKRQAAFADQLPDVLQLVTTALRSGYGITQAIESVAEEAEEPARSEFAHVLIQTRLGRDLTDGLHDLADRMDSKDLSWVVSAIDINRETGGNLSEILHQVGVTIRERGRVARQVRTLTAEGRLSARILTGLPFLMILWQRWANPDNFALLTHGVGVIALVCAGVLMAIGTIWVHKVVRSVAL